MRIQKEIENVERVENRQPVEPLTMEDAVIQHKKAVDKYEEERKEINKELDLDDDIEEKGFTGASKETKKVVTPELKKMKLSESLFEALNEETLPEGKRVLQISMDVLLNSDTSADSVIEQIKENTGLEILGYDAEYDLTQEYSDAGWFDESLNEEFKISDKAIKSLLFELYDIYSNMNEIETFYKFCLFQLKMSVTDMIKYVGAFIKTDLDLVAEIILDNVGYYGEDSSEDDIDKAVKVLKKHGINAVKVRDYDDYDEEEVFDLEIKGLLNKNTNESLNEDWDDLIDDIDREDREKKQAEATQHMIDQQEKEAKEEERKAKEEAKRKERMGDDAWGEKDWIAEREKGNLDFSKYSDEEKAEIEKRLKAFDEDPTAQAKYKRKKEEEARAKAKKEKEERTKKNLERIDKAANAPKEVANALKKGLGNAGIHIG